MLAYAANNRPAGRSGSPRALALIIAGHAVLIAGVMTAKMDLVTPPSLNPTDIINIPLKEPEPVPPPPPTPNVPYNPPASVIDQPALVIDVPIPTPSLLLDQGPQVTAVVPIPGTSPVITPAVPPKPVPVRAGPRFATPDNALRPPYPLAKLRAEEEATLRLRLAIDARGRVTAVDAVGAADPQFLEAARRHIIKAWRYKPATEDGVGVASSTVITLSFRLDEA